jgi:putative hemolysin
MEINEMKKLLLYLSIFGLGLLVLSSISCKPTPGVKETNPPVQNQKKTADLSATSALANPAATKCVNDGFILKPVIENGVTSQYLCINPGLGLKCEVWAYFRGECSLSK